MTLVDQWSSGDAGNQIGGGGNTDGSGGQWSMGDEETFGGIGGSSGVYNIVGGGNTDGSDGQWSVCGGENGNG